MKPSVISQNGEEGVQLFFQKYSLSGSIEGIKIPKVKISEKKGRNEGACPASTLCELYPSTY